MKIKKIVYNINEEDKPFKKISLVDVDEMYIRKIVCIFSPKKRDFKSLFFYYI